MLFADQTRKLIEQSYKEACSRDNELRKAEAKKRLDFYHGIQGDYTREAMERLLDSKSRAKFKIETTNITANIIDAQAKLFKTPPQYRIKNGTKRDQKIWNEVVENGKLNLVLKNVNRYTKLLKTVVLHPIWRGLKIEFDILLPHLLDIEIGWDPVRPTAYIYETIIDKSTFKQTRLFTYWSPYMHFMFDENQKLLRINEDNANPYGILPFVAFHDYLPLDSFFLEGDDVVDNNENINIKKTDLARTIFQYGFPLLVGWGLKKDMIVGQGVFINLDKPRGPHDKTDIEFRNPNAQVAEIWEVIKEDIINCAVINGVPAYHVSNVPRELSGIAHRIQSESLLEQRKDDVEIYKAGLKQLFQICKIILAVEDPVNQISDKAELIIDFHEPEFPTDPAAEYELLKQKVADGILSKVDLIKHYNPDFSDEQAMDYLDLIASTNKLVDKLGDIQEDEE